MSKRMLIDATHNDEMRVAVVENDVLVDFDFENFSKKPLKGNVYLGKIVRIEPSLQAAFVDYGGNRHGFLAFTEIHPDYFRIPVADRPKEEQALIKEEPVLNLGDSAAEEGFDPEFTERLLEDVASGRDHDVEAEDVLDEESHSEDSPVTKTFSEKTNPYKTYRIQEVIQSRQVVLVQVVKEERGNKGAALTSYVSLAGRYCVLMPNATHGGGVSRRITDIGDRRRLKQLMQDLEVPSNMSLIVRTAGLDRSKTEIKRDYTYLMKLWGQIREQTLKATAPELIYEEANLLRRAIRDLYVREIEEVLIDGEEGYKEVKTFMKDMVPSHAKKVQRYRHDDYPLFYKYKIERQIEKMYAMDVQLKSGGYIVINPTEALVSIDVNSGKATRERHIDSTAYNTNLEAAEEIARQVRLRDLAGLIVIDFIDMTDSRHNQQVEKKLKDALAIDRARVQVGRISQFGLLEMSRQRLRPSIVESSTTKCPTCTGAGFVRSAESFALQLVRVLEEICLEDKSLRELTVHMPSHIAFYLLSERRHEISQLEEKYTLSLDLREDDKLSTVGFRIEHKGRFIIDGLGAHGKTEDHKDAAKDENKKNKAGKKPRPQRDLPHRDAPHRDIKEKREGEGKVPEVQDVKPSSQSLESSSSAPAPHVPGEENQPERRKRSRYRGRRKRPSASPEGQQNTSSQDVVKGPVGEGNAPAVQAAPAHQEVRERKPAHHHPRPKNEGGNHAPVQSSTQVSVTGNVGDRPAPKGSRKKGWWQRLLDS
jgi:ribonuclease E